MICSRCPTKKKGRLTSNLKISGPRHRGGNVVSWYGCEASPPFSYTFIERGNLILLSCIGSAVKLEISKNFSGSEKFNIFKISIKAISDVSLNLGKEV